MTALSLSHLLSLSLPSTSLPFESVSRYINFFKLDKMVEGAAPAGGLGGTKGGVLGETVRDIYFTFKRAAESLKGKGYDLLDIGARSFDQDYADFKVVREDKILER